MKDQPITIRAVRAYSLPSLDSDKAVKNSHSVSDVWNVNDNNNNKCISSYENNKNDNIKKGVVYIYIYMYYYYYIL